VKAESHWAVEEERDAEYAVSGYDVSTPVPGPRTVYQGFFDFGFHLPSPESTVVVDPAAVRLAGTFQAVQLPVPASSISGDTPPIVTLDSAREVKRIDLSGHGKADVQLFRVDQSQLAPKPTVTTTASLAGTAFFSGFTDVRFAVDVDDGGPLAKSDITAISVQGAPTGGRLGLADPGGSAPPAFFWTAPNPTSTHADAGPAFATALQAYLAAKAGDTSPTARLVIQCDQPCRFSVSSFATGASFALDGFAFPGLAASDLTDADALAARIAAAADPVSSHLRSAIGHAALVDGLNGVIAHDSLWDAGRFAGITLSAQTEAAKTAGDLPRLNRLLLQDAYPDLVAAPSAKRVLRFPADRAEQAGVAVSLPAGASVSKAVLSTQESLGADRPGDAAAATAPTGGSGVHVSGDDTAAVSVTVAQALTASGLALPLLGLSSETQVAVELIEDDQGAPAGKALAAATAALSSPGSAEWSTVHFDPVVLDAGPVWIALRAPKGEAVWLATSAADGLHVVRTPDDGAPTETVLPGLQPVYQLLSRDGSAADRPATTLQVAATTIAATRDADKSTYDLAAALLEAAGGLVPLTFTSTAAGTITVYPPHVEYEL
jgi:hypothetical protein